MAGSEAEEVVAAAVNMVDTAMTPIGTIVAAAVVEAVDMANRALEDAEPAVTMIPLTVLIRAEALVVAIRMIRQPELLPQRRPLRPLRQFQTKAPGKKLSKRRRKSPQ